MATQCQITFDCANPVQLAKFWALAMDYELQEIPKEWLKAQNIPEELWDTRAALTDPAGVGPRFWFQQVSEPKTAKNRLHLDLRILVNNAPAQNPQEREAHARAKADQLIAAGATKLYEMTEFGQTWLTLADPEGNEFCIGC